MQKPLPKGPRGTPRDQAERILKTVQKMGWVRDFSIGTAKDESGTGAKTDFIFSSALPPLEVGKGRAPLDVSFSSMDHENESLLHFLFGKARK